MKDRIVEHPNRYRLVAVPGEAGVFDLVPAPGVITEVGTPINKASLLSDETALALGMPQENPTINDALNMIIPKGVILLWKGSVSGIPVGWRLCDGANGTPDLRNRFVVGAGGKYVVDAKGGVEKTSIPPHAHSVSGTTGFETLASSGQGDGCIVSNAGRDRHTHTFNTTSSSGGGGEYDSLPPYYALCYIMKI